MHVPSHIPTSLLNKVKLKKNIHNINTRDSQKFFLSSKAYFPKNSVLDAACILWNDLSSDIHKDKLRPHFKDELQVFYTLKYI